MADSSRIRYALDKSISLGKMKSGRIAVNPNGAYILRLVDSEVRKVFIEVEIIAGKLISLKSFNLGNSSEVKKVYFTISAGNFLYFITKGSGANDTVPTNLAGFSDDNFTPKVFVEYNLMPVTVYSTAQDNETNIPSGIRINFDINRTYYLSDVYFDSTTSDVTANNINIDTLNIRNFKTDLSELQLSANAFVAVPKLLVQTVGIEQMDVDTIQAKNIATKTFILSNGKDSNGSKRGWVFSADSNNSDAIILTTDIDSE